MSEIEIGTYNLLKKRCREYADMIDERDIRIADLEAGLAQEKQVHISCKDENKRLREALEIGLEGYQIIQDIDAKNALLHAFPTMQSIAKDYQSTMIKALAKEQG